MNKNQKRKTNTQGNNERADLVSNQEQGILDSYVPSIDDARNFLDEKPLRAAAIGAIAGGAIFSLLATAKGREFAKAAVSYANPYLVSYARQFVSNSTGEALEQNEEADMEDGMDDVAPAPRKSRASESRMAANDESELN